MSERGGGSGGAAGGFGPFLLGVAVGAVLGFLFAPEPGEDTRRRLSRHVRRLRELAGEKAEELGELLEGDAEAEPALSAREELARRLEDARRRRRGGGGGGGGGTGGRSRAVTDMEEDEPVA